MCPKTSFQDQLIHEVHGGGFGAHLGRNKILATLNERYHWPHIKKSIMRVVNQCAVCLKTKRGMTNMGLYTPLPISKNV